MSSDGILAQLLQALPQGGGNGERGLGADAGLHTEGFRVGGGSGCSPVRFDGALHSAGVFGAGIKHVMTSGPYASPGKSCAAPPVKYFPGL